MELQLSSAETATLLELLKNRYANKKLEQRKEYLLDQIISRLEDHSTILFPGPLDELNYEIMYLLGDDELFTACKLNMKTAELCRNEQFWRNRVINVFGVDVKPYLPSDTTFKQLYRDLSDPKNNKLFIAIDNGITPLVKEWFDYRDEILWKRLAYLLEHKIKTKEAKVAAGKPRTDSLDYHIGLAVQRGDVDTVDYIFSKISDRDKYLILSSVSYKKMVENGHVDMFYYLIDVMADLEAKGLKIVYQKDTFAALYNPGNDLEVVHMILNKLFELHFIPKRDLYELITIKPDYDYIEQLMDQYPRLRGRFFKYWAEYLDVDNIDYNLAEIMLAGRSEDEILNIQDNQYSVIEIWYNLQISINPDYLFSEYFFNKAIDNNFPVSALKYIYNHSEKTAKMQDNMRKILRLTHSRYAGISTLWLKKLARSKNVNIDGIRNRTQIIDILLDAGVDIENVEL